MANTKEDSGRGRMKQERRDDVPPATRGNTVTAQGEDQVPKPQMPHERDESSHSQAADNPSARRMGEIAHDDVMEGQQDTSKAPEMDATYHRVQQTSEAAPRDKPNRNRR